MGITKEARFASFFALHEVFKVDIVGMGTCVCIHMHLMA
jgi:hypothetical protein